MDSLAVPLPALLATAVVLIVLSTVFSATESAFFSVNKLRVRLLRGKQDKRAIRVWNLLKNKDMLSFISSQSAIHFLSFTLRLKSGENGFD